MTSKFRKRTVPLCVSIDLNQESNNNQGFQPINFEPAPGYVKVIDIDGKLIEIPLRKEREL